MRSSADRQDLRAVAVRRFGHPVYYAVSSPYPMMLAWAPALALGARGESVPTIGAARAM